MSTIIRRTKIVTTLGPSTDRDNNLEKIIEAGANTVRLNFSHGSPEDHENRAIKAREIAKQKGVVVAILGDLQGPKIRVSTFKEGKIFLNIDDVFVLDAELPAGEGTKETVGIDYKELPTDVQPGDILLLDDGKVQLKVQDIQDAKVITKVIVSGPLSNNKGINKLGGGLSAEALTEKDKRDIKLAAKIKVDYLAVSFPRSGADLEYARKLANEAGFNPKIVAKVERAEAVASDEAMLDIIHASDVIMVARGDLGVEIGDPQLVAIQKRLIELSRQNDRVVITATQMMESMIKAPLPTRAEVSDVSNAILDGTDAVMLSAETASGDYPVETVTAMANISLGAEKIRLPKRYDRFNRMYTSVEQSAAMSAMYSANHFKDVKAIIAMTSSGNTALMMSRISTGIPIFALSRHETSLRLCALYRGVRPIYFDHKNRTIEGAYAGIELLKQMGYLEEGDTVILTQGEEGTDVSSNICRTLIVK
ncbi:MAG: pyruvate kinase [Psittacicella sp.]